MKDILVTGANGLLGTNVIHALVAAGYNATGLLRRKDSFRGALSGSLELVEGDITSQADVMRAAAGCDAIIHCAACTSQKAGMKTYYDSIWEAPGISLKPQRSSVSDEQSIYPPPTYSLTEALNIPETNPGNPLRRFRNPDMY